MAMPRMGPDPFSWAQDYNRQMTAAGMQGEANAQNTLMSVFQQEAARQRPWSDLPVDLAKQNNAAMNAFGTQKAMYDYKQSNMPPAPVNEITDMIYNTSKSLGFDPIMTLAIADIETGGRFDPKAKNPNSTAFGLMQQLDQNWAQYGRGLDRNNPQHQVQAGIAYMNDVAKQIEAAGQQVTPGLMYFGYQQGPGAVRTALRNLDADAVSVFGRKEVLNNGGRPGQTVRSFMQKWISEGDRRYERHKAVRSRPQADDENQQLIDAIKAAGGGANTNGQT